MVEYIKSRGRWGFRFRCRGKIYTKRCFRSRSAAAKAEREFRVELEKLPLVQPKTLGRVVAEFLVRSRQKGRSEWRLRGLWYNYFKFILPYFHQSTIIYNITPERVEDFIRHHLELGKSPSTVWHYVVDLRALLKFAGVDPNPVDMADRSKLQARHHPKPVFDPAMVERAAAVLEGMDRVYFDFCRFTGCHKDEANGVEWSDVDFAAGTVHIRGTKNKYRNRIIPLHPVLAAELQTLERDSEFVFANRSNGQRQYSRAKLLTKIQRLIGIKLTVKDLRDYFATMIARREKNLPVLRDLLGHASITTTDKYIRRLMGDPVARELVYNMNTHLNTNLAVKETTSPDEQKNVHSDAEPVATSNQA